MFVVFIPNVTLQSADDYTKFEANLSADDYTKSKTLLSADAYTIPDKPVS
jgi:hypothetical protein